MYIKALEQEVLRLKELYGSTTQDRDLVVIENQKLKEILAAHGIPYDSITSASGFQGAPPQSFNGSSSGSISGSYANTGGFSPPTLRSHESSMASSHTPILNSMGQLPNHRLDYDQIGIDFVLTYDSQGRPIRAAYPSPPPNQ